MKKKSIWPRQMALLASMFMPSGAAFADDRPSSLPDPATITVPDISTNDPNVIANGYKFFVFYNASVDFATAFADIAECQSFLPAGFGRSLPAFIPLAAAPKPRTTGSQISPYGLVGDVIGAIILPKLRRGKDAIVLRRCLEPRGYVRYAVTKAIWDTLNDPKNPLAIAMQAKLATGPKPIQPEIIDQ